MPKYKKYPKIEDSIKSKQQTTSGLWISAGEIDHSDYDKTDWIKLQADYAKMRNGNGLVETTVEILKLPIYQAGYTIEGENNEVNDYVQFVLEGMYKGFDYFKHHKLLALDFGVIIHEIVVENGVRVNGKLHNVPTFFSPIQNETVNRFFYSKQGIFEGIEHERREPEGGTSYVEMLKDKLDMWSYHEEFGDVRGRSILRPIRQDWDSLTKILSAKVRGIQRGAGFPAIGTEGDPTDAEKILIEKMGRTLSTMNEGYFSYNKSRLSVDLLEPKSQADAMPIIDYLTRNIMFNTLSQFLGAGLGGNGSRAATSEHKTSYEMAASAVNSMLEDNVQQTVNKIIRLSGFKPSVRDWPKYKQNAILQTDTTKAANEFKTLFESKVFTKTRKDEVYMRDALGFPELSSTVEIVTPEEKPALFETDATETKQLSKKKKERSVSLEVLEHEKNVFSLESAHEHYSTMEEKIAAVLEKSMGEYIDDIARQLKTDRHRTIRIRESIREGLIDELTKLYEVGFIRGETDFTSELKKISSKALALPKKNRKLKSKVLDRLTTSMFFNVKTKIENKMDSVSDSYIKKQGGTRKVFVGFETGFKRDKLNIKNATEAGYVDGRGEALKELSDEIENVLYSAVMDTNTCDECAPFDGQLFQIDEIGAEGLNTTSPINPFCLGGNSDRCQWIPVKVKL